MCIRDSYYPNRAFVGRILTFGGEDRVLSGEGPYLVTVARSGYDLEMVYAPVRNRQVQLLGLSLIHIYRAHGFPSHGGQTPVLPQQRLLRAAHHLPAAAITVLKQNVRLGFQTVEQAQHDVLLGEA